MKRSLLSAILLVGPAAAFAQDRLPTIPPGQYTAEQTQAAEAFEAARGVLAPNMSRREPAERYGVTALR